MKPSDQHRPVALSNVTDVWNLDTFDEPFRDDLHAHSELIADYYLTSRRLWLEREASDHVMPRPDNARAEEFLQLAEHIMALMEKRAIRAWHYTRLTDNEVERFRSVGVHLSTLSSIRTRFDAMVDEGFFSRHVADRLFADSPFQSDQRGSRLNKFWMVSHPAKVDDGGVEPLLGSWGGEAAYFWQRDPELQNLLQEIGKPRVLEIAVPLCFSSQTYSAAEAVLATYGRMIGATTDEKAFDLYTSQSLGPSHLLAVHSEGDATFRLLGRGYPKGYAEADPD